jgi:hypothetical protein
MTRFSTLDVMHGRRKNGELDKMVPAYQLPNYEKTENFCFPDYVTNRDGIDIDFSPPI